EADVEGAAVASASRRVDDLAAARAHRPREDDALGEARADAIDQERLGDDVDGTATTGAPVAKRLAAIGLDVASVDEPTTAQEEHDLAPAGAVERVGERRAAREENVARVDDVAGDAIRLDLHEREEDVAEPRQRVGDDDGPRVARREVLVEQHVARR